MVSTQTMKIRRSGLHVKSSKLITLNILHLNDISITYQDHSSPTANVWLISLFNCLMVLILCGRKLLPPPKLYGNLSVELWSESSHRSQIEHEWVSIRKLSLVNLYILLYHQIFLFSYLVHGPNSLWDLFSGPRWQFRTFNIIIILFAELETCVHYK